MTTNGSKTMKHHYRLYPHFILRAPLFPVHYGESEESPLTFFNKSTLFRNAIFIASPQLYYAAKRLISDSNPDKKQCKRVEISLLKYLIRMSSRSTPFGLFSGFCHGEINNSTKIQFKNPHCKTFTRPDMEILAQIAVNAEKDHKIRSQLKWKPNNSVYKNGGTIRFIEFQQKDSSRNYTISSVKNQNWIQETLNKCETEKTLPQIDQILKSQNIPENQCIDYREDLINNQLLKSNLEPNITGEDYGRRVLKILQDIAPTHYLTRNLQQAINLFDVFDEKPDMETLVQGKEKLLNALNNDQHKHFIQTDSKILMQSCTISRSAEAAILDGIEVLRILSHETTNKDLEKFIEQFTRRFGDREIALSEALDSERGIAYPEEQMLGDNHPLIDDLVIPIHQEQKRTYLWNSALKMLHTKVEEAFSEQQNIITLTDKDLGTIQKTTTKYDNPLQFSALIRVLSTDNNGNPKNICIGDTGGTGGINLMARFAYACPEIHNTAQELCENEELYYADKIIAEIVHLPEERTGNILFRPVLHKHEIPYIAHPGTDSGHVIPVDDLMVSIRNGRPFLRSVRHNKEVIPRLSTAHNFHRNALPVYRFLCDLQRGLKARHLSFSWGELEHFFYHLPELKYKNITLAPEQWIIHHSILADLNKTTRMKEPGRNDSFSNWRIRHGIPDIIYLCQYDNQLRLNLTIRSHREIFYSTALSSDRMVLKRYSFDQQNALIADQNGGYTNEINIVIQKQA